MAKQELWEKLEKGAADYYLRSYCRAVGWKGTSEINREKAEICYFLPDGTCVVRRVIDTTDYTETVYILKIVNGKEIVYR